MKTISRSNWHFGEIVAQVMQLVERPQQSNLGLETQQQLQRIRIDGYDRSGSSEACTNINRARGASRAVSIASLLGAHRLISKEGLLSPDGEEEKRLKLDNRTYDADAEAISMSTANSKTSALVGLWPNGYCKLQMPLFNQSFYHRRRASTEVSLDLCHYISIRRHPMSPKCNYLRNIQPSWNNCDAKCSNSNTSHIEGNCTRRAIYGYVSKQADDTTGQLQR